MLGALAWAFCFGFTSWKLRAQFWLQVEYADTLEANGSVKTRDPGLCSHAPCTELL